MEQIALGQLQLKDTNKTIKETAAVSLDGTVTYSWPT
jgi:hypothetical protein